MKTRRPARLPNPRLPPARSARRAVQAYASAPSAPAGGTMEFRVSVPSGAACSVAVRRIGTPVPTPAVRFVGEDQDGAAVTWVRVVAAGDGGPGSGDSRYGPAGGSGSTNSRQDIGESADGIGVPLTWCDWEPSLLLDIPESWPPGLYVARFSVEAPLLSVVALRGRSAYVPFVVRGPLAAGFPTLVILPFAAYIAANPWPVSDVRRARALSLDRPFAGNGLPAGFAADAAFVEPLTATDFATSLDRARRAHRPGRVSQGSVPRGSVVAADAGRDRPGLVVRHRCRRVARACRRPPSTSLPGPTAADNRILIRY